MKNATISITIRRSIAIASLCAFVAAATAIWLGSGSAQAAPDTGARKAKPTRVQAEGKRGTSAEEPPRRERVEAGASAEDEAAPRRGARSGKASGGKKSLSGKLNLNTASEEQLCMLPGVGPAKAQRIIESRAKEGQFRRVRDLRRVKGFGAKTLKKLEPYLAVEGASTLTVE